MRAVLFLLLVQFITPAFLSFDTPDDYTQLENTTNLTLEHRSFLFPVLLKENEENEYEEGSQRNFIAQLIFDFSDHSSALIESHQSKYTPTRYSQWQNDQPLLFTLFCTYNI
ncbi:MAG TPA: hypothetical protein VL443_22160 [Cyclobacteriaceae bacterium]|nr:hypothetical protein [Cyclobacteriaceae bacterium]